MSTAPLALRALKMIGVFDSGVGGLSVLRALHAAMPGTPLCYIADSAYAPYGERPVAEVLARSARITQHLVSLGAAGIVVACNTATALAIDHLRTRWPNLPIVGIEPGIKPAIAATRNRRIGVMATPATLASAPFARLVAAQADGAFVLLQPCPGLAHQVEAGDLDAPELIDLVRRFCEPLRRAEVDTVVLGCTHYPLIARHIQAALGPHVTLVDTAGAVARHAAQRLGSNLDSGSCGATDPARIDLLSTGDPAALQRLAAAWLPFIASVERVELDQLDARAA